MQKIKAKLSNSGYKITKPRVDILSFLEKANKPYSAQEIFKKIKNVDLASVYRALTLFAKLDIVNEEIFDKEKKYCLATDPHHHIVCRKCDKMETMKCEHNYSNKFKNFSNIKHQLVLTGVCNKCKIHN